MHNKFSFPIIISSLIANLIIGISIGYYFNPDYQQSMVNKSMDLGVADRWVDLRYIDAMIAHHRAAILLADQAKESSRPEIQTLSASILADEPKLISQLYDFKLSWYGNSRQVKDPQVTDLGTVDETFDLRFLNALIFHHQDGLKMTQEIRTKSSRSDVLNNANNVENFLRDTLLDLKTLRQTWYDVK